MEIDIAIYSFNIVEIRDALVRASSRGVHVKLFTSYNKDKEVNPFFDELIDLVDLKYIGESRNTNDYYHMHQKFMIVVPGI